MVIRIHTIHTIV